MNAKRIVEVTSQTLPLTIGLAAAVQQTGGRLVCILPEPVLDQSKEMISNSGLKDQVEFRTEDPFELLPSYENIDFSLVDCKNEGYTRLLNLLDVNPTRSVVVANNLVGDRRGLLEGYARGKDGNVAVRSLKHPIGKGMEVTLISKLMSMVGNGLRLTDTDVEKGVRAGGLPRLMKRVVRNIYLGYIRVIGLGIKIAAFNPKELVQW